MGMSIMESGMVDTPKESASCSTATVTNMRESGTTGKGTGKVVRALTVGILYYANNDRYEGEWKDNMANGRGTFPTISQ